MKAFQRLDHLLCDVPNIQEAFDLFHEALGFPVAWPIGRYWPQGQTCGLALGAVNLEFIQTDKEPVSEATIRTLAFEPTDRVQEQLDREGFPYKTFEKWESNPDLLRMRNLMPGHGAQLLCTNFIPADFATEFPFFACRYSVAARRSLLPLYRPLSDGNFVQEVVLGHPQPSRLGEQLSRLGIQEGVKLSVAASPEKEVLEIVMKNGPIDLDGWPARFKFTASKQ